MGSVLSAAAAAAATTATAPLGRKPWPSLASLGAAAAPPAPRSSPEISPQSICLPSPVYYYSPPSSIPSPSSLSSRHSASSRSRLSPPPPAYSGSVSFPRRSSHPLPSRLRSSPPFHSPPPPPLSSPAADSAPLLGPASSPLLCSICRTLLTQLTALKDRVFHRPYDRL